ncbi:inositol monophosphatase [Cryomorpha ignava]|uniref:Inositol-1-monophosphatase n=1 Tax=Cryomorpha ignava TaxID=101383 RepID=A0A7K3WNY9_9FLAO|nr:inositol monophosphatase family protein [Cryomorpha ignava]NEN23214.1 inositol monophosphatase [Cryomorpha ignava]
MSNLLEQVIAISREVGQFLKYEQAKIRESEIEYKGRSNDMVSRADKEAEQRFVDFLSKLLPHSGFIAEEGTSTKVGKTDNWIIDPLDGTTNYLYGIPCYCTSVALQRNGELILGVIYDPTRDECFAAEKGKGATLNGTPIKVSAQTELEKSLIATGFPYDNRDRGKQYLDILLEINANTRGMRRLGSAALDMAYVACGRFEAFYEYGLNAWDVAAGAVIVREAGGNVSSFKNGADFIETQTIFCDNRLIHSGLLDFLKGW